MKFGLFCLLGQRDPGVSSTVIFDEAVELVKLADEIGLDTAWFAEHHFSNYCLCVSPLMMATYCAPLTTNIRLGTGVVVLPLYDPIRLIEEIATVDVLSRGRLVLGIGSGYQAFEFDRFRTSLDESIDRSLETLDMMDLAFSRKSFSYDGRYYKQPPTSVGVKPIQQPSPEIFVAGMMRDERVRKRVVEKGYVPLAQPRWGPPSIMIDTRRNFEQMYEQYGKDPAEVPLAVLRWLNVTESKEETLEAADSLRYTYRVAFACRGGYQELDGHIHKEIPTDNEPDLEDIARYAQVGDVDKITAQIKEEILTYHPSHMCFNVGMGSHARAMRTLERLGGEIIPRLEAELGALAEL